MTSDECVVAVVAGLESLSIPYMLVGSFSTNFYGIPRLTKDADFVIQVEPGTLTRLGAQLGTLFRVDPQMSFETVTLTMRTVLEPIDLPFRIELFHLSEDPHDLERFRRRKRATLFDQLIWLPTAEDVIITKLRWVLHGRRSKDWDDIRGVIAVQADQLDWDYIKGWTRRHGTHSLLEEIRSSIPPL